MLMLWVLGGCNFGASFGYKHSLGALCHYYGQEAGLELQEDVETVLEPGMVLSLEVGTPYFISLPISFCNTIKSMKHL